ncbi:snRNA-activating protein complex subunit 2 [Silurus asotus]|uniref:snRNA-activating protein complex subunit 2 n=1 Tax=Silurus asotus TaxID=30991 RepID=A0AAD5FAS2_SILAS|nr:snRNA-activating protein complex subunit 2 [Silurus asotus]
MKPPSRRRITPSRFSDSRNTESIKRLRPECDRQELRSLLLALKQQNRLNSELDFLALRKKVPKCSLLQIQNMIKFLRKGVLQRVYMQVHKQRREEQKNKVPTELWGELAQKMAGVHEETISSAFSQMLVIASTEPCSLSHSDPPRNTDSQGPLSSGLRTVPLRSMPKSHASSPPSVMILPGQVNKTPQSHKKDAVPSQSTQTTTVTSSFTNTEAEHSELQQATEPTEVPATPSTSATHKALLKQQVSKPTPPVSASSAVPSNADHQDKQPGCAEQIWQYRPMGANSVVDFEKIYQFLCNIILQKNTQPLTAMESAVLLDLLMSLPEELPLLNCKELQHHLLQVYPRLSTPAARLSTDQGPLFANSTSTREAEHQTSLSDQNAKGPNEFLQTQSVQSTGVECVQEGAVKATELPISSGDFEGQSPAIKLADKGDWATAGLCPLNPFMLPLALLKRQ